MGPLIYMIRKKILHSSTGPYANLSASLLGKDRGNLARGIAPQPKVRRKMKYKIPPTPKTSGLKWGGQ